MQSNFRNHLLERGYNNYFINKAISNTNRRRGRSRNIDDYILYMDIPFVNDQIDFFNIYIYYLHCSPLKQKNIKIRTLQQRTRNLPHAF